MKTETYYAIRIGDPRGHCLYLKLVEGKCEPELFTARAVADEWLRNNPGPTRKVVKVRVSYAG